MAAFSLMCWRSSREISQSWPATLTLYKLWMAKRTFAVFSIGAAQPDRVAVNKEAKISTPNDMPGHISLE